MIIAAKDAALEPDAQSPEAAARPLRPVRGGGAGQPPPHRLDLEHAVVEALLTSGHENDSERAAQLVGALAPEAFYSDALRRIFGAGRELVAAGRPVDATTVVERLRAGGLLDVVGGLDFVGRIALAPATRGALLDDAVRGLRELANVRRVIAAAHAIAAEGYSASDFPSYVESARGRLTSALDGVEQAGGSRVRWTGTAAIFAPLEPMRWVVPGLMLGAGRPAMLAGYGFSGKTLAAQALALAVASGRSAWGCPSFVAQPGRVLHFDHEQGLRATCARYQRLAVGHGVDTDELGDRLAVAVHPPLTLTGPEAEVGWSRECEGAALAIVDSLRLIIPGVDENDSQVGELLAVLARTSERTGTAFVVVHHAGKPRDGHSDSRTVLRGSSAIFSACGAVYLLAAAKGRPTAVSMEKSPAEAEGGALEPFFLEIEDVPGDAGPKAGLRVSYRTAEQVEPPAAPGDALDADTARALDTIRRCAPVRGKAHLAELMHLRRARADVIVANLLADGRVVDRPEKGQPRLWPNHSP